VVNLYTKLNFPSSIGLLVTNRRQEARCIFRTTAVNNLYSPNSISGRCLIDTSDTSTSELRTIRNPKA